MTSALFALVLSILALFLIMLVLVQRGRGGGLAGALGGMGGSSAFGAKAGDIFTRITIYSATVWIIVCVAAVLWANNRGDVLSSGGGAAPVSGPAESPSSESLPIATPPAADKTAGDAAATESKPATEAPATPSTEAAPSSAPPSTPPAAGAADTATPPPAKSE